jgi:hypothetical protein
MLVIELQKLQFRYSPFYGNKINSWRAAAKPSAMPCRCSARGVETGAACAAEHVRRGDLPVIDASDAMEIAVQCSYSAWRRLQ